MKEFDVEANNNSSFLFIEKEKLYIFKNLMYIIERHCNPILVKFFEASYGNISGYKIYDFNMCEETLVNF